MSDLIRRDDAIKALRCEYPTMPMFKSLREEWAIKTEGFRKAEVVIMSIPSADRPQGEWIPCSERLPREYEVLCCDIYKNCIVGHPFADDSASTGFCAESEGEFMYECIAWMPLPKPWKGADDE